MKRTVRIAAAMGLALCAAVFTGCTKKDSSVVGLAGQAEIVFTAGSLQLEGTVAIQAQGSATRAVGSTAPIAVDTTFRVVVAKAGESLSATPFAENTYKLVSPAGGVAPTAVNAAGTVVMGPSSGQLTIPEDTYDFYYFSPALPFSSGSVSGLGNGHDYMAARQNSVGVACGADHKYHIAQVQFSRLCARIDVQITAKADAFIQSMAVADEGSHISGLATDASYTLGDAALSSVTGTDGMLEIKPANFTVSGSGTATMLTSLGQQGFVVLPVSNQNVKIRLNLLVNSAPLLTEVELPNRTFDAGYKYQINVQIDKMGSPSFTVTASPWLEGVSQNADISPVMGIGTQVDGGIVYWINPTNPKNFKVVSLTEGVATDWAGAVAWVKSQGAGWDFPYATDLTGIYNARQNYGGVGTSRLDIGVNTYGGVAFGNEAYWSSNTADASNAKAAKLTDGVAAPYARTDLLAVRAVKTFPESFDYTDNGMGWFLTAPVDAKNPIDGSAGYLLECQALGTVDATNNPSGLKACPDGWRMPKLDELMLMYCYRYAMDGVDLSYTADKDGNTPSTGQNISGSYYSQRWEPEGNSMARGVNTETGYIGYSNVPQRAFARCIKENTTGGTKYPYVAHNESGKAAVIVSRDENGGVHSGGLHPQWTVTPPHTVLTWWKNAVAPKFEVAPADAPGGATFEVTTVSAACVAPWRVPTQKELYLMFVVQDQLTGITPFSTDEAYLSVSLNSMSVGFGASMSMGKNSGSGPQGTISFGNDYYLRCVRDLD